MKECLYHLCLQGDTVVHCNSNHIIALFCSIYLHALRTVPACVFIHMLFFLLCLLSCYFLPNTETNSMNVRNYLGINQILVQTLDFTEIIIHV